MMPGTEKTWYVGWRDTRTGSGLSAMPALAAVAAIAQTKRARASRVIMPSTSTSWDDPRRKARVEARMLRQRAGLRQGERGYRERQPPREPKSPPRNRRAGGPDDRPDSAHSGTSRP